MIDEFHSGQLAVQKIAGEEEIAIRRIPTLKASLHPKAVNFIEHQILAFLGSEDVNGDIWVSLFVGKRGFIKAPSLQEVTFDLAMVTSDRSDIFFKNIETNPKVGLLWHEAIRRKRYRAWGMAQQDGDLLSFDIRLGYASCPKHIQKEEIELPETAAPLTPSYQNGTTLGEEEKAWILGSHTFFMATASKDGDLDASHRGGDPGFIELLDNGHLRVPDYLGNSLFSTLGNIYENPKTGLLFIDYEKGETLQLTGDAALQFDQKEGDDFYKSGDTGRFWTFETKKWIRTKNHHKLNAEFVEFSRFNFVTKA